MVTSILETEKVTLLNLKNNPFFFNFQHNSFELHNCLLIRKRSHTKPFHQVPRVLSKAQLIRQSDKQLNEPAAFVYIAQFKAGGYYLFRTHRYVAFAHLGGPHLRLKHTELEALEVTGYLCYKDCMVILGYTNIYSNVVFQCFVSHQIY